MMYCKLLFGVFCCAAMQVSNVIWAEQPTSFDPKLQAAVEDVRSRFLAGKPFSRADVVVLVRDETSKTWRTAGVNADALSYPASSVKLAYLAAAMNYCRLNGLQPDALNDSVRPMIERSDNVKTGVVVDTITSSTNITDLTSATDPRYAAWVDQRSYVMKFLDSKGLLQGQSIFNKTYPTNSGNSPSGAEKVAVDIGVGKNRMHPSASAQLMLQIVMGELEPEATDYMRDVLTHDRWKGAAATGPGFPPGTLHLNKAGWAYNNANDIVYAKLPNGRELIIGIFTDAYIPPYKNDPSPHEKTILSQFAELLIYRADLVRGCPPVIYAGTGSPDFSMMGKWERLPIAADQFASVMGTPGNGSQQPPALKASTDGTSSSPTARWSLTLAEPGKYEVCVWYPASTCAVAQYTIEGSETPTTKVVDQRKVQGRWNKLGDFQFTGKAVLSVSGTDAVADAVRLAKWPANSQ